MSSTPRYQSRLFKTVQSQFHQLQDKIQLRWRQLKVATVWGAQLGLYPFFAIFQAERWGGRVFQQTAAHGARALSAALGLEPIVEVDQPVQNLLDAIDIQQFPIANLSPEAQASSTPQSFEWQISIRPPASPKRTWQEKLGTLVQTWRSRVSASKPLALSPSSTVIPVQPFALQGIASALSGRQLVLVSAENQILDILSTEQQDKLRQRIIWEVANALRSQQPRIVPPLPAWQDHQTLPIVARPQMSLPVRGLHRLMAWVQQQPTTLTPVFPALPTASTQETLPSSILPSSILSITILPISILVPLKQTWVTLQQTLRTPLSRLAAKPSPAAKLAPAHIMPSSRPLAYRIAMSARALFAVKHSSSLTLNPSTPKMVEVMPRRSERIGQWLSEQWSKRHPTVLAAGISAIALLPFPLALPEPAQAAATPSIPMPLPTSLPIEWRVDPSRLRKRTKEETDIEGLASQASQGKVRVPFQKSPKPLSPEPSFETAIADWANRYSKTTVSSGRPPIEIDAVFAGYDRHPLQELLLNLDQAMAWIEAQFAHWWPIAKTKTIQFYQHWQPIVQAQLSQLWQYWSPIIQQWSLSAWHKTSDWLQTQSVNLWQRGVCALQNWMARNVQP